MLGFQAKRTDLSEKYVYPNSDGEFCLRLFLADAHVAGQQPQADPEEVYGRHRPPSGGTAAKNAAAHAQPEQHRTQDLEQDTRKVTWHLNNGSLAMYAR